MTRLAEIVETSHLVAKTPARREKIGHLAATLAGLAAEEVEIAVGFLSGAPRQGRIGIGGAVLSQAMAPAARAATLTLAAVDRALDRVAAAHGAGSAAERRGLLEALFAEATAAEQDFLFRLLLGELRQGALEGVLVEAVARAAAVPPAGLKRALMLRGDLGAVARAALTEGETGLARFSLRLFQPLKPMLADSAEDVAAALARLGRAALEYKLDGARIQLHKGGAEVRVYTRELNEVSAVVPEIVAAAAAFPVKELVIEGEAIALAPDGRPRPFQTTMRRFGRKHDDEGLRRKLPLSAFFFDCLMREGEVLLDRPARERFAALAAAVPQALLIPHLETAEPAAAEAFYEAALAQGHEGVMAKAPEAPYAAGRRVDAWLKIKRAKTLDLVVLAAEWGHGRRRGKLSNLHLGARDAESGGYVMLGKTFKGLTDAMLAWQTERLLALERARDAYTVHVRPELVVEVAYNDIQASPRYPGGMALRFARVKAFRPEKRPEDADTIATVREAFRSAARAQTSHRAESG